MLVWLDGDFLGAGRDENRFTCLDGEFFSFFIDKGSTAFKGDVDDKTIQFRVVGSHGFGKVVDTCGEIIA